MALGLSASALVMLPATPQGVIPAANIIAPLAYLASGGFVGIRLPAFSVHPNVGRRSGRVFGRPGCRLGSVFGGPGAARSVFFFALAPSARGRSGCVFWEPRRRFCWFNQARGSAKGVCCGVVGAFSGWVLRFRRRVQRFFFSFAQMLWGAQRACLVSLGSTQGACLGAPAPRAAPSSALTQAPWSVRGARLERRGTAQRACWGGQAPRAAFPFLRSPKRPGAFRAHV